MTMFRTTFFVGMLCILSGTHVNAQTRPAPPKIGDVAPEWKNLVGTDDQKHSLAHLADASVVVLVFTSNSCPYSVDYEDRTIALKKKYADTAAGVEVVAINSNAFPEDELDKMKQRAAKKQFNFPYLRDDSQDVARVYGAVYTPEFYVLDRNRRIIYRGALDDSTDAEKVSVSYIDLAIEAAIAGKLPEVTTTGARGCTIRFRRRRR